MKGGPLDHVALWTDKRDAIAEFVQDHAGMHVIERTDKFTLVGADARKGKLTLFEAEGPREPGALGEIGLRVRGANHSLDAPGGLKLELVEDSDGDEWDLHHVTLRVPDPTTAMREMRDLGFVSENGGLRAGDKLVYLVEGEAEADRPLLNHLALLVDSVKEHVEEAERRGLEHDVVDAPNTIAVFVTGPYGIRIEYVEHKPGFALK
jgi:catechol 2,3-dioxygenase-like lactoylglutathione lyase family enzyme